ncbi:hypothetical protein KGD82_08125 [Nocardiopsis eucommiae]|uniref:Uncharacterized protein n=1 Tax=Nocardiopsis eucommiae TaxID=2831970 RepID=A0A975LAZ8_9ACTN|nr:hypothetical protein KGD82_08125 [Nocardiopsis eucommiae]
MPVDAFMRVGAALLERGLTVEELRQVTSHNAAFLLGLEDERPAPIERR